MSEHTEDNGVIRTVKEIDQKISDYLSWFKNNPPHVLGHLRGGIDKERMEALKQEIENRPQKPTITLIKRRRR